jgi:hypothetical protein
MKNQITTKLIDFLEGDISNVTLTHTNNTAYHYSANDNTRDNIPTKLIVTEHTTMYEVEMVINGQFVNIGGFYK